MKGSLNMEKTKIQSLSVKLPIETINKLRRLQTGRLDEKPKTQAETVAELINEAYQKMEEK
ncbi:hypothetical protein [Streptococcus agalactiae]|uniref:hypothetical protein n=2 Tax=Streptococcus TaxID=1301 RepID=UPI0011419487|nr:hypothetical protein [Streptococcus agalactiae]TQC18179.1 hypothetical protein DAD64_00370 [Streptococcus agalactiae]